MAAGRDTTLFLILYRRQVVEGVTECTLDKGELHASGTVLRIMLWLRLPFQCFVFFSWTFVIKWVFTKYFVSLNLKAQTVP